MTRSGVPLNWKTLLCAVPVARTHSVPCPACWAWLSLIGPGVIEADTARLQHVVALLEVGEERVVVRYG